MLKLIFFFASVSRLRIFFLSHFIDPMPIFLLLFFFCFSGLFALEETPALPKPGENLLFQDLTLVKEIDQRINDELPFFYNSAFLVGYFNMPSARVAKMGMFSIGAASIPPYQLYGANMQPMDRIEVSANYRVFKGCVEKNFGHEGFGDDAERIANVKFAILTQTDGFKGLPSIAFGLDDFIGTKRFNSKYVVATKEWLDANLEVSLGWGTGRIKGFFGGATWTPFRQTKIPVFKTLSLMAEYDAINYREHTTEHFKGRSVKSRINAGLSLVAWDTLQLSVSSLRGEKIAGSASIRCPLGTTKGLFKKIDDPLLYQSPVDIEPLGPLRPSVEFAQELAYAFSDEGLDLFTAYLTYNEKGGKILWIKVINNRYRQENVVRQRIESILAALAPTDIVQIIVVVEADALESHAYHFRVEDLERFRLGIIGSFEMKTLSAMKEATPPPNEYEGNLIFHRKKPIWTFTFRPRLLTFFGSTKGKFKYTVSIVPSFEGYLPYQIYYKFQGSYNVKSSMAGLGDMDKLNPSQLPNVRSDTLRYFETNSFALEQAYIQKGWNLGKGCFGRLATGYFEPAYAGGAAEFLYYPVNSNWAIGAQGAIVWKRHYHGLAFFHKIRKFKGHTLEHVKFLGKQYFLDLYYDFKPLDLGFRLNIGQFLAKDKGVRTIVTRYFPSGVRFSLWLTLTNGHDKVNGKTYYDKGFALTLPLDIFLKQSSRNFVGYAMSAWLRDVGAMADTGKSLYSTLYEERFD